MPHSIENAFQFLIEILMYRTKYYMLQLTSHKYIYLES